MPHTVARGRGGWAWRDGRGVMGVARFERGTRRPRGGVGCRPGAGARRQGPAGRAETSRTLRTERGRVASAPRAAWQRIRTSLAQQVIADLEGRLGELSTRLDAIELRLRELRDLAETQVDSETQTTELLGRLLRSATSRIDELEERAAREP